MKKIISSLCLTVVAVVLLGAYIRRNDSSQAIVPVKKKCIGFTIVEYGKGIDCNGDTVKLVRVNGVQVLAESL